MRLSALAECLRNAFFPRTMDDPVLGRLRFRGRLWTGQAVVPGTARSVRLDVFTGESGPSGKQRALFSEMARRWSDLRAAMERPLFVEHQKIRSAAEAEYDKPLPGAIENFAADYPAVTTSADIWTVATLSRIELYGRRNVDLCLNHAIRWADDHQLNVLFKNWSIVDVAYEG